MSTLNKSEGADPSQKKESEDASALEAHEQMVQTSKMDAIDMGVGVISPSKAEYLRKLSEGV